MAVALVLLSTRAYVMLLLDGLVGPVLSLPALTGDCNRLKRMLTGQAEVVQKQSSGSQQGLPVCTQEREDGANWLAKTKGDKTGTRFSLEVDQDDWHMVGASSPSAVGSRRPSPASSRASECSDSQDAMSGDETATPHELIANDVLGQPLGETTCQEAPKELYKLDGGEQNDDLKGKLEDVENHQEVALKESQEEVQESVPLGDEEKTPEAERPDHDSVDGPVVQPPLSLISRPGQWLNHLVTLVGEKCGQLGESLGDLVGGVKQQVVGALPLWMQKQLTQLSSIFNYSSGLTPRATAWFVVVELATLAVAGYFAMKTRRLQEVNRQKDRELATFVLKVLGLQHKMTNDRVGATWPVYTYTAGGPGGFNWSHI